MKLTHYIIIRDDLSRGTAIAQATHAAGESGQGKVATGTYAVVLAAKSSGHLEQISSKLKLSNVEHCQIVEPDMPFNGELLAIGVVPKPRKELRKHFSNLPLLR